MAKSMLKQKAGAPAHDPRELSPRHGTGDNAATRSDVGHRGRRWQAPRFIAGRLLFVVSRSSDYGYVT
jgi:hypothetical protein